MLYSLLDEATELLAQNVPLPLSLQDQLVVAWNTERPNDSAALGSFLKDAANWRGEDTVAQSDERRQQRIVQTCPVVSVLHAHPMSQPVDKGWLYPVYFATNRFIDSNEVGVNSYSARRSPVVHYGRCDVLIPRARVFGDLGSPFWRRWKRLSFTDDQVRVHDCVQLTWSDVHGAVKTEMDFPQEREPQALVYIHGYNCSFADAAVRAAQLGFDLKISGATAFFSWPSQRTLRGYLADAAAVEASELAVTQFLRDFAAVVHPGRIHVIAHSMGNRALVRAIQQLALLSSEERGFTFGQIVMAAPDVDRDHFLQRAKLFPALCRRTTLYASEDDRAVQVAAWLQGDRVGYPPPITSTPHLPTLNTVLVPGVHIDLLNHSLFAQAAGLLNDIYDLVYNDTHPNDRPRLEPCLGHWRMLPGRPRT